MPRASAATSRAFPPTPASSSRRCPSRISTRSRTSRPPSRSSRRITSSIPAARSAPRPRSSITCACSSPRSATPFAWIAGTKSRNSMPMTILDWAADWLPGRKALIVAPVSRNGANAPLAGEEAKAAKQENRHEKSQGSRAAASLSSLFQILREQGFSALLVGNREKEPPRSSTSRTSSPELPKVPLTAIAAGELFVVVDRLRLTESRDKIRAARLLDSIDQALAIGRGQSRLLRSRRGRRAPSFSTAASPAFTAGASIGFPSRISSRSTARSGPARAAAASASRWISTRASSCPIRRRR